MSDERRALVVGEGIAGQAAALALADRGLPVLLLTRAPAEHAESTQRHDGIDAALDVDDSSAEHLADLIALAGEPQRPFLAALTSAAPELALTLQKLDVPFERTRQGELLLSKLPGSSRARSLHAGCRTAQHVSRRLSALVSRHEAARRVERLVGWSVVELVLDDDGRAGGVVAQCFATGECRAFEADGICFAGGGHAGLFADETLAPGGFGSLTGLAHRHGAKVVALRRVSSHPFCYRAGGFVRRLPRRLEALGADLGAGLLDLSKLDRAPLRVAAGPALEAYARATGADPYSEPVPVFSAPDRTLGGLDVSEEHATSIPGLYAAGGAVAAYFGEATTEGTPLTAALFGGRRAAHALAGERRPAGKGLGSALRAAEKQANQKSDALLEREGDETVADVASDLVAALSQGRELGDIGDRLVEAKLGDDSPRANARLRLAWELESALVLARSGET